MLLYQLNGGKLVLYLCIFCNSIPLRLRLFVCSFNRPIGFGWVAVGIIPREVFSCHPSVSVVS